MATGANAATSVRQCNVLDAPTFKQGGSTVNELTNQFAVPNVEQGGQIAEPSDQVDALIQRMDATMPARAAGRTSYGSNAPNAANAEQGGQMAEPIDQQGGCDQTHSIDHAPPSPVLRRIRVAGGNSGSASRPPPTSPS